MATTVKQIDEAGVEEKNVAIYPLQTADLTTTVSVLQTLFPAQTKVSISADTRRRSIVALAPPERQAEIQRVIAQLEEKGTRDDMTLTVYPLESEDATAFLKVLQPVLEQGITHSHDTRRNSLIVWGTAEQHEKIRQAFQQLAVDLPEPEQLVTQVYHLQNATAYSAYTALTPLVPKATLGTRQHGQ